ncbi:MAG: SDR family oxidoreductase [Bacteroidota bacterium]
MKISLQGQVVLVTGGARGIGKAIVEQFAQSQATVAIHYRSSSKAAQALATQIGQDSHAFQADLEDPSSADALVDLVIQQYGRIDVLVNNAGISPAISESSDLESWQQAWQQTFQVNLFSAARLTEGVIPYFRRAGGGRIVHIASRAAFRGDTPQYMAYAASKGGMVAYSRSIARYYGKEQIHSFVVAPGFTRTDMAQEFMDRYGEEHAIKDLALNRLTEPQDVAPTVVFLASGMMDHATGCTIDINAGSYVR